MLKGQLITTLDKSGRIRLPASLRRSFKEKYGREVFITSLDGKSVQIFPFQEWKNMTYVAEESILQNPTIRTSVLRANRLGVKREIDKQGRILIHKYLRSKINLEGEITIYIEKTHLKMKKVRYTHNKY